MPLWNQGRLAIVDAVGNNELSRSHFDAQDFMETGTPGNKNTSTGWLDRALKMIPGSAVSEAVAFQSQLPRSFMGPEPVLVASNLTTFNLKVGANWRTEAETALRGMYGSRQDAIGKVGRETFEAIDTIVRSPVLTVPPANGAVYPNVSIGTSLRQAAAIIKAGLGTRTIFVSVGGAFDTHSGQLAAHQVELPRIGDSLAAFAQDLGGLMDDVVLMMVSEFGRTAFVNGSAGTDHGSAKAVFVLGGSVRGGRMLGRWPGLADSSCIKRAISPRPRTSGTCMPRSRGSTSASPTWPLCSLASPRARALASSRSKPFDRSRSAVCRRPSPHRQTNKDPETMKMKSRFHVVRLRVTLVRPSPRGRVPARPRTGSSGSTPATVSSHPTTAT